MVGIAPAETEVVSLYNELLRLVGDENDIVRVRQILWRLRALSHRHPGDFRVAVAHCRAAAMAGERPDALAAADRAWALRNGIGPGDGPVGGLIQVTAGLGQYERAIEAARVMLATGVRPLYAINYLAWCGFLAGDLTAIQVARTAAFNLGIDAWDADLAELQRSEYQVVASSFAEIVRHHVGDRQLGFYGRTSMDLGSRTWTILLFVSGNRGERREMELAIDEELRSRCDEIGDAAVDWADRICVILAGHYPQDTPVVSAV